MTLKGKISVVVVLRSPIHANEPSEYNGMLYRTSNRVLNNGIKVIILICMDGTSQYHHHQNLARYVHHNYLLKMFKITMNKDLPVTRHKVAKDIHYWYLN